MARFELQKLYIDGGYSDAGCVADRALERG